MGFFYPKSTGMPQSRTAEVLKGKSSRFLQRSLPCQQVFLSSVTENKYCSRKCNTPDKIYPIKDKTQISAGFSFLLPTELPDQSGAL